MRQYVKCLLLPVIALLVSCSTPPEAAAPSPIVITQIVPQTVVVTQIATVVVTATPLPATPIPPTPIPLTPTALPRFGQWDVLTDTSSFDDTQRVVLSLDAEQTIETGFGTQRPTLILRCQEGATEAYIVTGTPPDVEADNLDGATVRVRFDEEPAEILVMSKSTDDMALFFEDVTIMDRMASHERLLFEFTPFNQSPTEVRFDLRGLPEAIVPLRAACGTERP